MTSWGHWRGEGMAVVKGIGEAWHYRDSKSGRPVVVVTGTGVLTSLGPGKQDNWAR